MAISINIHLSDTHTYIFVEDTETQDVMTAMGSRDPAEDELPNKDRATLADLLHFHAARSYQGLKVRNLLVNLHPVRFLAFSGPLLESLKEDDLQPEGAERYLAKVREATRVFSATLDGSLSDNLDDLSLRNPKDLTGFVITLDEF